MEEVYVTEYEEFMNKFRLTEISGEEVGVLIMRMAHYYAKYNSLLAKKMQVYMLVRSSLQGTVDDATGKSITSAKVETLAASTPQAADYEETKAHVENLEQFINALKALQRGVLFEYANSA